MDAKKLGTFIAELRKEKQLTQAELAEKLNVTDKAVSRWERGVGFPDINTLEPLADVLGISITELMKCQHISDQELNITDADSMITAGFDIAKYQSSLLRKKVIHSVILCLIGISIIAFSFYVHYINQLSYSIIGGADGPTSIFLVGKLGGSVSVTTMGCIIGILIIVIGLFKLFKMKKS